MKANKALQRTAAGRFGFMSRWFYIISFGGAALPAPVAELESLDENDGGL
jgi:hypothetical protein